MTRTAYALDRGQCCIIALAILTTACRNIGNEGYDCQAKALDRLERARQDILDCCDGRMSALDCACAIEWYIPSGLDNRSQPSTWHARDAIRACISIMEVSQ